jgi:hypothetical protein
VKAKLAAASGGSTLSLRYTAVYISILFGEAAISFCSLTASDRRVSQRILAFITFLLCVVFLVSNVFAFRHLSIPYSIAITTFSIPFLVIVQLILYACRFWPRERNR